MNNSFNGHQSKDRCADLREQCQQRIFEKMDNQHKESMQQWEELRSQIMQKLSALELSDAYREGAASKRNQTNPYHKSKIAIQFILAWGLPIAFLLILGILAFLKVGGYLG